MKRVHFLQPGVESSSNTWEPTTLRTFNCVNTAVYVHTVGNLYCLQQYVHTYGSIHTMGEHLCSTHILYTGDEHSTVTSSNRVLLEGTRSSPRTAFSHHQPPAAT